MPFLRRSRLDLRFAFSFCVCLSLDQIDGVWVTISFRLFDDGGEGDSVAVEDEIWVDEIPTFPNGFGDDLGFLKLGDTALECGDAEAYWLFPVLVLLQEIIQHDLVKGNLILGHSVVLEHPDYDRQGLDPCRLKVESQRDVGREQLHELFAVYRFVSRHMGAMHLSGGLVDQHIVIPAQLRQSHLLAFDRYYHPLQKRVCFKAFNAHFRLHFELTNSILDRVQLKIKSFLSFEIRTSELSRYVI